MTETVQAKKRKNAVRCIALVATVLVFLGFIHEFMPEIWGLAWHIRHGRSAKLGNYFIPSSVFWPGLYSKDGNDLSFSFRDGKRDLGMILFSVRRNPISGAEFRAARVKADQKRGQATNISYIKVIDSPYTCIEQSKIQLSNKIEILCLPETEKQGLSGFLTGDAQLKSKLFETLQSIRKSK